MRRVLAAVGALALVVALAACGGVGGQAASSDDGASSSVAEAGGSPVEGKRVAYVMQMAPSEIFEMWAESAAATAEGLGMEFDAFFCDGSDEAWRDTVTRCAEEGYDGLLLSHGGQDYAYPFLSELKESYPELEVVTFDTLLVDDAGEAQTIDGVTQFFQQDAELATLLLDYACEELCPEKVAAGEPVNVLKVWVGPGYLAAFDRREEGYAAYEQEGLIHTVETIGPSDLSDPVASVAQATTEALSRYGEGEVDAIWCCYDLYAEGVYEALEQGGYDIPLLSVDICNGDIEKMSAEGSPWVACATTNWSHNGEFGVRVLALQLAGERDAIVDPLTGTAAAWLELPASLVTQEMVSSGDVGVADLDAVAGEAYNDRSWMPTTEWMAELLGD